MDSLQHGMRLETLAMALKFRTPVGEYKGDEVSVASSFYVLAIFTTEKWIAIESLRGNNLV